MAYIELFLKADFYYKYSIFKSFVNFDSFHFHVSDKSFNSSVFLVFLLLIKSEAYSNCLLLGNLFILFIILCIGDGKYKLLFNSLIFQRILYNYDTLLCCNDRFNSSKTISFLLLIVFEEPFVKLRFQN